MPRATLRRPILTADDSFILVFLFDIGNVFLSFGTFQSVWGTWHCPVFVFLHLNEANYLLRTEQNEGARFQGNFLRREEKLCSGAVARVLPQRPNLLAFASRG